MVPPIRRRHARRLSLPSASQRCCHSLAASGAEWQSQAGGVTNVKGEVLLAMWDTFKEHGIEIPYPHRQLLFKESVPVKTLPEV